MAGQVEASSRKVLALRDSCTALVRVAGCSFDVTWTFGRHTVSTLYSAMRTTSRSVTACASRGPFYGATVQFAPEMSIAVSMSRSAGTRRFARECIKGASCRTVRAVTTASPYLRRRRDRAPLSLRRAASLGVTRTSVPVKCS